MSRHHPRRRGLHAVGDTTRLHIPDTTPAPAAPVVVDLGPAPADWSARPDLLHGAVRAEMLADDWRANIRAEVAAMQAAAAEELAAEAATEQGDEPEPGTTAYAEAMGWPTIPAGVSYAEAVAIAEAAVGNGDAAEESGGGEWAEVEAASDRDLEPGVGTDEYGRVGDWSSRHDARSLEHGVRSVLNARAPLADKIYPHGPIFDQGIHPPLSLHDASGCTGYAFTAAVNILRPEAGYAAGDAFDLYLCAQKRDQLPGEAYAGTSVLAAAQEAKARGWIDAYAWCFGLGDIAQALLQAGPVVLGLPWLSQMQVSSDGVLTPGGDRTGLGHAIACIGIVREYAGRPGPWFVLQQSYGESAGVGGLLYVSADHLRLLLRGVGEACVPIIAGRNTP